MANTLDSIPILKMNVFYKLHKKTLSVLFETFTRISIVLSDIFKRETNLLTIASHLNTSQSHCYQLLKQLNVILHPFHINID